MPVADKYVYLIALIPFCIMWVFVFLKRKDLRQEMLTMSFLIGIMSVLTAYYWWTIDWWRPHTITNTIVGAEDFIMGFTSGGLMATIYELVFRRSLYKRKLHHHVSGGITILFLVCQITMYLFWGVGLTSFWASTIAMLVTAGVMVHIRKDLIMSSLLSAILMVIVSIPFYLIVLYIAPAWIDTTYSTSLSGLQIHNIPIEEFVFWFLSGLVFGPFYEYWQGEKLKRYGVARN